MRTYGAAAGGRSVSSRLRIGPPPADPAVHPWHVRVVDLDVLGHVNNSVLWAPVEEELARRHLTPSSVELEFLAPVMAGDDVARVADPAEGGRFSMWLTVEDQVRVQTVVETVSDADQGTR